MKALKITGITVLVLAVLFGAACVFITPLRNEIIFFYHYQTGYYNFAEKAAMEHARSGEPASCVYETEGKTYTFPLPNGSAEWPDGGYIAINYEYWGEYYDTITTPGALEDFTLVDQMGSTYIFKSHDGKVHLFLDKGNVARKYESLTCDFSGR